MKTTLTFFLFTLLLIQQAIAKDIPDIPEVPWRAIVESRETNSSIRWNGNVSVLLWGNYSEEDSIAVSKSITQLNDLLETVKFCLNEDHQSKMMIYFLDESNKNKFWNIIPLRGEASTWHYHIKSDSVKTFSIGLDRNKIPEASKVNFITNNLAFALFPCYWNDTQYTYDDTTKPSEQSIFRSESIDDRQALFFEPLHEFDKKLLHELYSQQYDEKFIYADKEYGTIIPYWIKKNAIYYLLIPYGLVLLLLIPVVVYVHRLLKKRNLNHWFHFNIIAIVSILLLTLPSFLLYHLNLSLSFNRILYIRSIDWTITFLAAPIIGIPTVNLFRAIELIIKKYTERRYLKTVLIFLSTALIPSISVACFLHFAMYDSAPFKREEAQVIGYILLFCFLVAVFRTLISYFTFKEKDLILESERKLSSLRELKTKAELNALHSKINPHFLYNSLNSIAGLAHMNADKTEHMALSLSKLFRYSINKEQSDWTTFQEELDMVKIYLDVEIVRFSDRLSYHVDIPAHLLQHRIPRFIIQPLVENAVKHGISKSIKGGEIHIKIYKEEDQVVIAVEDNGPAFPSDIAPGFGIQSIYDKLDILFDGNFELSFLNIPQKHVRIKF
ncbi:hypothetical protein EYV94_05870 [Puteibacter caeruleilacunae]|nr:hypothetical protein EYV94_05870 [Puteibacter caeruleilacunae]